MNIHAPTAHPADERHPDWCTYCAILARDIDHFACGHESCDMEPCLFACDDCGRTDGTHDMDIEH
jgi:hypothetical protein